MMEGRNIERRNGMPKELDIYFLTHSSTFPSFHFSGFSHPGGKETIHPILFVTGYHLRVGSEISSCVNQRMIRAWDMNTQVFELEIWVSFQ